MPAAAHQPSEAFPSEPTSSMRRPGPLNQCVRAALRGYLDHMDGHGIVGLHALVLAEVERPLFEMVLDHAGGNLTAAARMLGLTRATLRKRMQAHGIARGR